MAGSLGPLALAEIVGRLGGTLRGDPDVQVEQVATLEGAGPRHISFLANPRYRAQLPGTGAGAVIVAPRDAECFAGNRIVTDEPYLYFARVADLLNPRGAGQAGIHPSAVVEGEVAPSASVGPLAHVGLGARIGERAVVGPGCRVGDGAVVGDDSVIHANAVVYARCVIGRRTIIHSGAVIGADGFGYARERGGGWFKVPQIGRVVVGDDVEIGAGTTIDRGAIEDTIIEDGVKLDNQIQIGHNCRVGEHTAMAGCVGVAGSTRIGKRCTVGGAAMIIGHLTIADDVHISAGTFIAKSIPEPGAYTGSVPHMPHREWLRHFAHLRRLDSMAERVRALEQRLKELEERP